MTTQQFTALAEDERNFTPVQLLKLFVGTPFKVNQDPVVYVFTLTSVTNNTTDSVNRTITIPAANIEIAIGEKDPITKKYVASATLAGDIDLPEGLGLYFKAQGKFKNLFTAIKTVAGVPTEDVRLEYNEKNETPLAVDDYAVICAYIPYYSANTSSVNTTSESIKEQAFSDGGRPEVASTTVSSTGEFGGPHVYADPGRHEFLDATNNLKRIFVSQVMPFGRGMTTYIAVSTAANDTGNRNEFRQVTASTEVVGAPKEVTGLYATEDYF